jgi:hypothetical protein
VTASCTARPTACSPGRRTQGLPRPRPCTTCTLRPPWGLGAEAGGLLLITCCVRQLQRDLSDRLLKSTKRCREKQNDESDVHFDFNAVRSVPALPRRDRDRDRQGALLPRGGAVRRGKTQRHSSGKPQGPCAESAASSSPWEKLSPRARPRAKGQAKAHYVLNSSNSL